MSLTAAEKKVRKLCRVPGNCQCANCGTVKKLGFSTVCIKFHTFVCNNCKSSHQAISHRCKSLTMSSWTDAEVGELQRKGNDHARRTWLKTAPPPGTAGRPREGDHVDLFKRFVVDVYERKKFYGPDDGPQQQQQHLPAAGVTTAIPLSQPPAQTRQRPHVRAPVAVPPVAAPAPAPVADLLDFAAAPQTAAPSTATFEANFDAFQPTPAAPAPASSQSAFGFISPPPADAAPATAGVAPAAAQSGFGFIKAPPAAAPSAPAVSGSGFGFISSPPAAATPAAPNSNKDFADFSGMSSSTTAPAPAVKKPVMSNSGTQNASLISSMSMPASGGQPQFGNSNMNNFGMQQQGFGGGGQPQMMMTQPNMMGMPQQQQQQQMMMQQNMMAQQGMMQQNMMGSNNNMMMGGMNNNGMRTMMMNQQQPMMGFGGQGQQMGGMNNNMNEAMNSLNMNVSSMSAWSTGGANDSKK
jgi:hypothetical protein